MPEELTTAPPKRGRPKKVVEPVTIAIRQVCRWCTAEVMPGQNPPTLVTCAKCQAVENAWMAQTPCPNCGGRPGRSVEGIILKDGHRDSCLTRAKAPLLTTYR